MDIPRRAAEALEEHLKGRGTVTLKKDVVDVTWTDGECASEIYDVIFPILGADIHKGAWRDSSVYVTLDTEVNLRRDYSDTAIGVAALMVYLKHPSSLSGCKRCWDGPAEHSPRVLTKISQPCKPSSYPGSLKILQKGGEGFEAHLEKLGELLGALSDGTGHSGQRQYAAEEHLCKLRHLSGLEALAESLS